MQTKDTESAFLIGLRKGAFFGLGLWAGFLGFLLAFVVVKNVGVLSIFFLFPASLLFGAYAGYFLRRLKTEGKFSDTEFIFLIAGSFVGAFAHLALVIYRTLSTT